MLNWVSAVTEAKIKESEQGHDMIRGVVGKEVQRTTEVFMKQIRTDKTDDSVSSPFFHIIKIHGISSKSSLHILFIWY